MFGIAKNYSSGQRKTLRSKKKIKPWTIRYIAQGRKYPYIKE
jgi:hypothetical protein